MLTEQELAIQITCFNCVHVNLQMSRSNVCMCTYHTSKLCTVLELCHTHHMYIDEATQHKRFQQLASYATCPNAQDLCVLDLPARAEKVGALSSPWSRSLSNFVELPFSVTLVI